MGVTIRGLDEWIRDLEAVQVEGPKKLRAVVSRGAVQIKQDWKRRWSPVGAAPHQLPHVARGIGYDMHDTPTRWHAEIGVHPHNPQAPLAHFPEYGSVNNPPMPGGQPALDVEDPKFVRAVAELAEKLLDGRS